MPKSVMMQAAWDKVMDSDFAKNLTAYHPGFRNSVYIRHDDGSTMFWEHAFIRYVDSYVFVFTEHNDYHIFSKDDLDWWRELGQVDDQHEFDPNEDTKEGPKSFF